MNHTRGLRLRSGAGPGVAVGEEVAVEIGVAVQATAVGGEAVATEGLQAVATRPNMGSVVKKSGFACILPPPHLSTAFAGFLPAGVRHRPLVPDASGRDLP